ncbi:MAG: excinuclease ABC subunit A, partial [Planctomycetota bacterium]|nr:excinuclease ABC subunit A [Planctomycetota bacterium]
MGDLSLPCPACEGGRYRPDSLVVDWNGMNVAEVLMQPIRDLLSGVQGASNGPWSIALDALDQAGLGHLSLGRDMPGLSAGERQRVVLAAGAVQSKGPALYLLDEPGKGLHESDIDRLNGWMQKLVDQGHTILMSEHRLSLVARADWVLDLGPEGGPGGGQLVESGTPLDLCKGHTAEALRSFLGA